MRSLDILTLWFPIYVFLETTLEKEFLEFIFSLNNWKAFSIYLHTCFTTSLWDRIGLKHCHEEINGTVMIYRAQSWPLGRYKRRGEESDRWLLTLQAFAAMQKNCSGPQSIWIKKGNMRQVSNRWQRFFLNASEVQGKKASLKSRTITAVFWRILWRRKHQGNVKAQLHILGNCS